MSENGRVHGHGSDLQGTQTSTACVPQPRGTKVALHDLPFAAEGPYPADVMVVCHMHHHGVCDIATVTMARLAASPTHEGWPYKQATLLVVGCELV
jgi:hypothetical protein